LACAYLQNEVAGAVCPARAYFGQEFKRAHRPRQNAVWWTPISGAALSNNGWHARGKGAPGVTACWWRTASRDRAVFLYGFAKNELDDIDPDELLTLKDIAAVWLKANDREILKALNEDALKEVKHGEEDKT
jgi:hypothetical protein